MLLTVALLLAQPALATLASTTPPIANGAFSDTSTDSRSKPSQATDQPEQSMSNTKRLLIQAVPWLVIATTAVALGLYFIRSTHPYYDTEMEDRSNTLTARLRDWWQRRRR